jgi:hypothetical protein
LPWFLAGLATLAGAFVGGFLWRRCRRSAVAKVLAAIGIARKTDVSVPDGNGGLIHIEHLLLTARGLLILDVKRIRGVVFASDNMQEWTVIDRRQRFTFHNPQPALLDRVAALRLIARDIPVSGHVLFPVTADFSKGRPAHVILPEELQEHYAKPSHAELERVIDAFSPQWERVVAACEPSFRLAASA